ncbi:hypothetical protein M426DRAFT_316696 [Hypoxylon sp. CI-4A]|nr:hypothetical protein M426DRAFT_316696 [Hypoxylon sp. CI-4A]
MADSRQFVVPVSASTSFGIELEFLVAYLPTGKADPAGHTAASLPPLLRIDSVGFAATIDIIEALRATLRSHGVVVSGPGIKSKDSSSSFSEWQIALDTSVEELVLEDGHRWQAVEVRSPARWACQQVAFEEIEYVVNLLTSSHRLRVNPTAGFHVHVGNGEDPFPAEALKRTASFLWAADPLFSRLHAPWRRLCEYATSVRVGSEMVGIGFGPEVSRELERTNVPTFEDIPVTEFSDTTREEADHGGKEGWLRFVEHLNEVGPFMTLSENLDDRGASSREEGPTTASDDDSSPVKLVRGPGRPEDSDDGSKYFDSSKYSKSSLSAIKPLELPAAIFQETPDLPDRTNKEAIDKLKQPLLDDREVDAPPEPNQYHRNVGWVRWDNLQPGLAEWVYKDCRALFGTKRIHKLEWNQQLTLMFRAQCLALFGHTDFEALSREDQYKVLLESSDYVEAASSRWKWDEHAEKWELDDWDFIPVIHSSAKREIKIDAPYLIRKFDNLARLTNLDDEHIEEGFEFITEEENKRAIDSNRNLEEMLESLRSYASTPGSNYKDDEQDSEAYKEARVPIGAHSSDHSSEKPHTPSTEESKQELNTPQSSELPGPEKLEPHSIADLSDEYIQYISEYMEYPIRASQWASIGVLPSLLPTAADPKTGSPEVPGAFSAADGVSVIQSCTSAAAVGDLLFNSRRLNYNFNKYSTGSLRTDDLDELDESDDEIPPRLTTTTSSPPPTTTTTEKPLRTIEFREAAGTLDARWITTWARICAGAVRWARDASVFEFMRVLDRIYEQEDADRRRQRAAEAGFPVQDEVERYNVVDLLEDMGLFAEAASVRMRERTRGPPR